MSNIATKNENAYQYDELNMLVSASEHGWRQNEPDQISPDLDTADKDFDGTAIMDFDAEAQLVSRISLDLSARSLGVDLKQVFGVNKIEIRPESATHRVRGKDLALYASETSITTMTRVANAAIEKADDGTIRVKLPTPITARYLKILCAWDDMNLDGEQVDASTFKNAPGALVRVWTLSEEWEEGYGYDGIGNRTRLTVAASGVADKTRDSGYYPNANNGNSTWLRTDGEWFYQYDAAGNTVTKAKALSGAQDNESAIDTSQEYCQYDWDAWNRLTEVRKNGEKVASYAYDALNHRVMRQGRDGTKSYYAYGRQGALAYQYEEGKDKERSIVYAGAMILGWTEDAGEATTTFYAVTDNLGSVTQVQSGTGASLWESEYLPFGQVAGANGSLPFDGFYTGKDVDPDTGLRYHWNRWTSEDGSRFMSEDPARDGVNWYGYCGGNPILFIDPTGFGRTVDDYYYMKDATGGKGDVGEGQTGPAEKLTPNQRYREWAEPLWNRKSELIKIKSELRDKLIKEINDSSLFADMELLFIGGRWDVFGPEYQDVAKEMALLDAVLSNSMHVVKWLENSDTSGKYRSVDEIDGFVAETIKDGPKTQVFAGLTLLGMASMPSIVSKINSLRSSMAAGKGVSSALDDASSAAFKAADDIAGWYPKNKHLLSGAGSKARFATDNADEVRALVQEGLRSPNATFAPNPNLEGTFRVITDMGKAIGIKGQQFLRTIVGLDGKVINSFPVNGL